MKKVGFLLLLTSILLFNSCNNNIVLKEFHSISNLLWDKSDKVVYKVNISDSLNYNIIFPFRYVYENPYKTVSINIGIESPSGNQETIVHEFDIMDDSNMYIGAGAGDIWDLETNIKENYKFPESGEYTFTIWHNMPQEKFPFVMEVGLIIELSEK